MKSKTTKKYKRLWILMSILSLILLIGPMAYFSIVALLSATLMINKVVVSAGVFVSIIAFLVCLVNKTVFRSKIWILLIGLYLCLDAFIPCLIITGCCQILDEIVVSPLKKHYKNKFTINKEMDKRG